ncbi:PhoX family phosphatase [Acinetobacter sp. A3.8]|uniref:PhoX family phosphatase n=1 Tax=Acinetobacter sedimenti TaxID=2919922 RepID=A0A9X1WV44_9GAMM|nr:PhoX family phosphatase [Acinetobacter sedimenti]MCJ8145799.1 PhoX family phosphatase [Acinetobacter sedimenti]
MTERTPYFEDQELDNNNSDNPHFRDILEHHISRRSLIKKTASATVALTLASSLVACSDDDNNSSEEPIPEEPTNQRPESLTFKAVDKNLNDWVTVPEGYTATVLYALGDPLNATESAWNDNNVPSGASFELRSGDCHDGMTFFGLASGKYDANVSEQGLLVMNHEYINQTFLHNAGPQVDAEGRRPEDEVLREMNSHGVSVIHLEKDETTQAVTIKKDSDFNRRITASTEMDIAGPVRNSDLVRTAYSSNGTKTRGTHNNCGNGYTPWGTYLTTEENFIGYFVRNDGDDALRSAKEVVALNRYGLKQKASSRYGWESAISSTNEQDLFDRWNSSVIAGDATQDYRNSANTFGWIVEIDPFDRSVNPVKRTALGRFAHEDCRSSRAIEGQPLAFYMGDDSRGEYIYKFVSDATWSNSDINGGYSAGDKYMNNGTLYVAKFNDDGTGEWVELTYGKNGLDESNTIYPFGSQADVVTFARLAADAVGATKMDRPEWCAVNPMNGEVYVTLTNNSNRGNNYATDAANPRNYADEGDLAGNINGHVIRFREADDMTSATSFAWDIYLFGAEAAMDPTINLSGLTDANDLSSPDGMWFDTRGVLWLQTDDGAYTDTTNCMMLAALPGEVGDGTTATTSNGQTTIVGAQVTDDNLRRFLTGPKECEITGVTTTPDHKAIFINVQHPGERSASFDAPTSHWPASQTDRTNSTARPRSATVVITRDDGGVIAG